jgi:hypothetical protein
MGWCSGTPIFDKMAAFVLDSDLPEARKIDVLYTLADAMENEDWDCQSDSHYYGHPLVQNVMRTLHPDWFEEEEAET